MQVRLLDLGLTPYQEALEIQLECRAEAQAGGPSTLILVEHPPVFTLGANFHQENLRFPREEIERRGAEIVKVDRGGDVTYHGPGQLVAYPIFDLQHVGKDLHRWMRDLEEVLLRVLSDFGVEGRRFPPNTGVWIGEEKVAAIGVKVSKWVSTHGIALNCDNDLTPFEWIVPCGIQGYGVTSLSRATGKQVSAELAKPSLVSAFASVFSLEIRQE